VKTLKIRIFDSSICRQLQAKLERENVVQKRQLESEQLKSHAAAAKAKEMIRVCIDTVCVLHGYF